MTRTQGKMNFLSGNKSSKVIHQLSSIAWLSLSELCLQHEDSGYLSEIEFVIKKLTVRIYLNQFVIAHEQKKEN